MIVILGSINIDHFYQLRRNGIVRCGETVKSKSYCQELGGKGMNQAAACALSNQDDLKISFIARAHERDKDWIRMQLNNAGIANNLLEMVKFDNDPSSYTGHAIIQVEEETGNNCILLAPGLNDLIDPVFVRESLASLSLNGNSFLVLQNEIPSSALIAAFEYASANGIRTVFNPSPVPVDQPELMSKCLEKATIVIMNEVELEKIYEYYKFEGGESQVDDKVKLRKLKSGPLTESLLLVVTRGPNSVLIELKEGSVSLEVPVPSQSIVVDTTGAGDCWLGYFVTSLSRVNEISREKVESAARLANKASSICIESKGAMKSIPRINNL